MSRSSFLILNTDGLSLSIDISKKSTIFQIFFLSLLLGVCFCCCFSSLGVNLVRRGKGAKFARPLKVIKIWLFTRFVHIIHFWRDFVPSTATAFHQKKHFIDLYHRATPIYPSVYDAHVIPFHLSSFFKPNCVKSISHLLGATNLICP